ncbi:MAG: biliverdin-producing heme oxygenase [Bacteroidota bacterium]
MMSNPSGSSPDFLARLRSETAPVHKDLEQNGITSVLMSPSVSTADYILYLQTVYSLHKAVEEQVFQHLAALVPDIASRTKTPAIQADLEALNEPLSGEAPVFDTGLPSDAAYNLGMLYVSEGSTLGGQYILKHIRSILGEQTPVNFLNIYGDRTGSTWKNFIAVLTAYQQQHPEQSDRIIAGALFCFERTHHLFTAAAR